MSQIAFHTEFKSELCQVKDVIAEALAFLHQNMASLSQRDTYEIKLILSELLVNAVIHGNQGDKTKTVILRIVLEDAQTIVATIRDEGAGFHYMEHTTKAKNNMYAENGRGLKLVQSFTDSLCFNLSGNEIKFSKKVAVNG